MEIVLVGKTGLMDIMVDTDLVQVIVGRVWR
jgi:hypothetical protein